MTKRCPGCMMTKGAEPICKHCGYEESSQNYPHQLPVGTILANQYQVGRVLGQGGFGITYIGWDQSLNTAVAIKEFYPNSFVTRNATVSLQVTGSGEKADALFISTRERFLKEAHMLAKLSNVPGVVRVQRLFEENNTAYIVMEYVRGTDLRHYMRQQQRPMTVSEVFAIIRPVMFALSKVHAASLIHRDVSPDNIMIQSDGQVKLLDFGAAREVEDAAVGKELPRSTEAIFKPGFAPTEQYQRRGSLGPWTDVYALCATIYYCLTGVIPNTSLERVIGDDNVDWSRIDGLSPRQAAALARGMALKPEDRILSMAQLWQELFTQEDVGTDRKPVHVQWHTEPKKTDPAEPVQPSIPSVQDSANRQPSFSGSRTQKKAGKNAGILAAVLVFLLAGILLVSNRTPDSISIPPTGIQTPAPENPVEETDQPETTESEATEPEITPSGFILAKDNILMTNPHRNYEDMNEMPVFGTNIPRGDISSVVILDTLSSAPDHAVDASFARDGSVKAWTVKNGDDYHLYIAGEGGVCAPEDSTYLFAGLSRVTFIDFGDSFYTDYCTSMEYMFSSCINLISLDVSNFNTSDVTNMRGMFHSCYNLTSPGVEHFDTKNVTDMSYMFSSCADLTTLDLRSFDTSNVTDMSYMFNLCENLVNLNVTNFNTARVESMTAMFQSCKKLEYLDLSSFDTRKVEQMNYMFAGCPSGMTIEFKKWGTGKLWNCMNFMDEDMIVNGKHWKEVFPVNYALAYPYS